MTNLTTEARRHGDSRGIGESRRSSDFFDHPITRFPSIPAINKVMQTIRATLREIFDESAYDRFLLRTHASRSVASYRAFTRERDDAMLKKPRCC
jgi:hypothetical protein